MKSLNEHYQPLNEDMRFEALSNLREIQSNLVGISFLQVIAIMKEENPLRKDVLGFQDDLDELTMSIQNFISKAKNGVDYDSEEDTEDADSAEDTEDTEKEPKEDDAEEDTEEDTEEEDDKKSKKPEDSSEPKE